MAGSGYNEQFSVHPFWQDQRIKQKNEGIAFQQRLNLFFQEEFIRTLVLLTID